ncbi:MAG: hypothetical protein JXA97_06940 [Anaerolineales bacterium]|nr:hypothetical protein [Anaerolineales bacterium]
MYAQNALLISPVVIARLRGERGPLWQELVERVITLPQDDPESLALSLTLIKINGCLNCETDSYRAMRGCTACSRQMLHRFKGSDEKLLKCYADALLDVRVYLESHELHPAITEKKPARAA